MLSIEEILKLFKTKQLEIMEAIQNHLEDDFAEDRKLTDQQILFIQKRMEQISASPEQTFTWNEVKEKMAELEL